MLKSLIDKFINDHITQFGQVDFYHQTEQELSFPKVKKTTPKIDCQFFALNDKLLNLLKQNNINSDIQSVIGIPNVADVDFVVNIKELFDQNKEKFSNIKLFADFIYDIISQSSIFSKTQQQGIFINLRIKDDVLLKEIDLILNKWELPSIDFLEWKKICIDYPSCNMAKQMTLWHLRTMIIWQSLSNIFEKLWGSVFRWNYLWDWWTPFGKVLCSIIYHYENFWDKIFDDIYQDPTEKLGWLYTEFKNISYPDKEEKSKQYFKMLENWDGLVYEIRKEIRRLSLVDFDQVFQKLDIDFDSNLGEAFAYSIQEEVIKDLQNSWYLREENNALIVKFAPAKTNLKKGDKTNYIPLKKDEWNDLDDSELQVMLIKKSDWAWVYATRDLRILKYRKEKLWADQFVYVVWPEQTLYFQLLFALANKLFNIPQENMWHISFGLMLLDGSKMSSREGNVYKTSHLIDSIKEKIKEKNIDTDDKNSEKLAISAMIFNDLKNDRQKDVNFDLEQMTKTSWDSGVYVQYTFARICSLIEKIDVAEEKLDINLLTYDQKRIISNIIYLPLIFNDAYLMAKPHILAQFLLSICKQFNNFYSNSEKIIDMENEQKAANLMFLKVLKIMFEWIFELLHIPKVEKF